MNNMYGITRIQTKAILVNMNDLSEVNGFLREYDGNIINIQFIPMLQGFSRCIIIYKAMD